jgi:hypothetical protein
MRGTRTGADLALLVRVIEIAAESADVVIAAARRLAAPAGREDPRAPWFAPGDPGAIHQAQRTLGR